MKHLGEDIFNFFGLSRYNVRKVLYPENSRYTNFLSHWKVLLIYINITGMLIITIIISQFL